MVLAVFENRRINERVKAYKLSNLFKCGPIKASFCCCRRERSVGRLFPRFGRHVSQYLGLPGVRSMADASCLCCFCARGPNDFVRVVAEAWGVLFGFVSLGCASVYPGQCPSL